MSPPPLTSLLDDAVALHRAGDFEAAEGLYRSAIDAQPGDVGAIYNLGVLLLRRGRPKEAVPFLARAVELDRDRLQNKRVYVEALVAAGEAKQALELIAGLRDGAADAAVLDALEAHAGVALGLQHARAGAGSEAEGLFRKALACVPGHPTALASLGALLLGSERGDEAEPFLRRAAAANPADAGVLANLGRRLRDTGQAAEARAAYAKLATTSDALELGIHAHLTIAPVASSLADIAEQRRAYAEGLAALETDPRPLRYGEAMPLPWYYLAYHGLDDRDLIRRTGAVLADKVTDLRHTSARVTAWRGPSAPRIRVVFVSSLLRDHTIGRLYQGIIAGLDRRRFEVVVAHGPLAQQDPVRAAIDASADASLQLPKDLAGQRAAIVDVAPDVLFYPDIGMTADTYFLAHSRLAPVQATAWGHPDTTGIAEMDYFLSTDRFEPPGGEDHYSERLVRLNRIPCVLAPPEEAEPMTRDALGLPASGRLYACPQTPYKLHPDFDRVLDGIASADPEGWIVLPLFEHQPSWIRAVQTRWSVHYPRLLERVWWTPRVPRATFLAQLRNFDVLLDPLHFGSGHTFYLAAGCGAPMVTTAGEFARGRVVAGGYAQMGVGQELVASDADDYVTRTIALGKDVGRRRELQGALAESARDALFSDRLALAEFGAFLDAAVEAAARGTRLSSDWKP